MGKYYPFFYDIVMTFKILDGPCCSFGKYIEMFRMIDSTWDIGIGILIVIFSSDFHELSHAWVAYRCGDDTAKSQGRLTLNPLAHICPFNSIILPALLYVTAGFFFGGAKPVEINPYRLKNPERDMALSAAAGPISNLILVIFAALLLLLLKPISGTPDLMLDLRLSHEYSLINRILVNVILVNLLLGIFNMIPVPPLDGSRILRYFVPFLRDLYNHLDQIGLLLLLVLIQIPGILDFIQTIILLSLGIVVFLHQTMPG